MKFELLTRSRGRTLLVIPGWGFDRSVFLEKNWDYDLVVCDDPDPAVFAEEAGKFLRGLGPSPVSVLGWSMGGMLARTLLAGPETGRPAGKAFIMCVPTAFDPGAVRSVRREIELSKTAGLEKFYRLVFHARPAFYSLFVQKYQARLLASLDPGLLLRQLDFLASERVPREFFTDPAIRFFYSLRDPVVSAAPVLRIRPDAATVPATHIPFWFDEVVDAVNAG